MSSEIKKKVSPSGSSTNISDEKGRTEVVIEEKEKGVTYGTDIDTSGIDEKKLIRKLDWALIPWLSFLYFLAFLDRTSIGNAKVLTPQVVRMLVSNPAFYSYIIWRRISTLQTPNT